MKVRKLESNHDWSFGNNQSDYLEASSAIKQCVLTAVLSLRDDWFLNLDHGIDWIRYMSNPSTTPLLESDLKRSISAVDGVYKIDNVSISLHRETRKATLGIEYTDIYNRKMAVNTDVDN